MTICRHVWISETRYVDRCRNCDEQESIFVAGHFADERVIDLNLAAAAMYEQVKS